MKYRRLLITSAIILVIGLFEYRYEAFGVGQDLQGPFDVIVVLGGPVYENGTIHQETLLRVIKAVSLYKEGLSKKILFSGGIDERFNKSVAEMMMERALSLDIEKDACILEQSSKTTIGNAYYIKPILKEKGWRRIVVITSDYHVIRANSVFRRVLNEYDVSWVWVSPRRGYIDVLESSIRERFFFLFQEVLLLGVMDGDHEGVRIRFEMFNIPL